MLWKDHVNVIIHYLQSLDLSFSLLLSQWAQCPQHQAGLKVRVYTSKIITMNDDKQCFRLTNKMIFNRQQISIVSRSSPYHNEMGICLLPEVLAPALLFQGTRPSRNLSSHNQTSWHEFASFSPTYLLEWAEKRNTIYDHWHFHTPPLQLGSYSYNNYICVFKTGS